MKDQLGKTFWHLFLLATFFPSLLSAAQMKSESFDTDPRWEARNNQVNEAVPKKTGTVTQDFGYTNSHFASKQPGEFGGVITRAFTPAFYAEKIAPKTLNDPLVASGTFALTRSGPSSGFFFGWFNAAQKGGSRPVGSLGWNFDGERSGGRLAVRLITAQNQSCGTFITPFIPGKFRPTPIRDDGTRYHWTMKYDPGSNGGNGQIEFSITSAGSNHEAFEGTNFHAEVPAEYKNQHTVFDHFGLATEGRPGHPMTAYFGDITLDGHATDFASDPKWDESGNRRVYQPDELPGAHHYGYSAQTSFAGGSPGEIGGTVWRSENHFGWYADRVGTLDLNQKLEAEGRVMLAVGAPDSAVAIGWFNSHTPEDASAEKTNFVGILIEGPTRVGHYFRPAYATATGKYGLLKKGPVITPGKTYRWKLVYDPQANNGNGSIEVTLGDETVSMDLKPGRRKEGALFDRFGIVSLPPGGGLVKIYFDDLKYTATAQELKP